MEYSLYLDYHCNLKCPFCYVKDKIESEAKLASDKTVNEIVKYVKREKQKRKDKNRDTVFFYGGEPLFNYKVAENFIKKAEKLDLLYGLYTNGTLLDKVPLNFLKNFSIIFVSISGDKKIQEKYRGGGSFEKIIKNIKKIKLKLKDTIFIARMTIIEEDNIYNSAVNLEKHFDYIHWQIVNQPKFLNPGKFIRNYNKNIEKLFDYWLANFRQGKNIGLIPFQAVIASLFFNYQKERTSFRCGAGKDMQIIDYDGSIYWCDELVGRERAKIGEVNAKTILEYKAHTGLFDDCLKCKMSIICRGRCRRSLEEYPKNHIRHYCRLTRSLLKVILKNKAELQAIIKQRKLTLDDIYHLPEGCTEEIP